MHWAYEHQIDKHWANMNECCEIVCCENATFSFRYANMSQQSVYYL